MDFILAVIVFIISLIFSIYYNISIITPLLIGMIIFSLTALHRGHELINIFQMAIKGMKKTLSLLSIFVLIGIITAVWRASGTISFLVYYGAKIMNQNYFILIAFLLTCFVSFALGTSFGTVGTIGVVLIVLAESGGVNIHIIAGAIISGAYFGDRCSPVSSSANLVAMITKTDLYDNVKEMFKTGFIPFIATVIIYLFLSYGNPVNVNNNTLIEEFDVYFNLHIAVILPTVIIFIMAFFKKGVKLSMLFSIISAVFICYFIQNLEWHEIIKSMIFGYKLEVDHHLSRVISGGGLLSMVKVSLIVLITSSYSGIFEGTGMLNDIQGILVKISNKLGVYMTTVFTSIITSVFCCNQALSILLTYDLMHKVYIEKGISKSQIAVDIENTVVLITAIIPWNIAASVPLATLVVDAKAIPYAVYLYLVPIIGILAHKLITQKSGYLGNPIVH